MDWSVLLYLTAISVATGILFGLAPALWLSRLDGNAAWRDGGHGATIGSRRKRLSSVLVAVEVALAVVLLVGAGVMTRSMMNLSAADLGVRTDHVVTARIQLPSARYPDAEERIVFYDRLVERLGVIPSVESAAMTNVLPAWKVGFASYEVDGAENADTGLRTSPITVSPSYFRTMGVGLLAGRDNRRSGNVCTCSWNSGRNRG
jgi:putative ABC transport system permease protein